MINQKEINCRDCKYFDKENIKCRVEGGSPIRKCVVAINKELAKEIKDMNKPVKILEVGCGSWSYIKDNISGNVSWEGIDVVEEDRKGRQTIATKVGSVENIPFADESFDIVLANQSMEHWYEYGVTFDRGLAEISRILKSEGKLILNIPIHLHGHRWFLKGEVEKIKNLFKGDYWNNMIFEKWRFDPVPLEKYFGWRDNFFTSNYLGSNFKKNSYILNIQVFKNKKILKGGLNDFKYRNYKALFIILSYFNQKIIVVLNLGLFFSFKIIRKKLFR